MKDFGRLNELWKAYLSNELSPEDYIELMRYIKNKEHDNVLRQKIDDMLHSGDMEMNLPVERAQQLLLKIQLSEKQTSHLISLAHPPKKKWWLIAASTVLVLLVAAGWFFIHERATSPEKKIIAKTDVQKATQPVRGKSSGKKFIRLPDGSFVILNEGSNLDYPEVFKGNKREVTLTGEAYFDVKHISSKPFIVHTGKLNTTVLGTAFNISAYPEKQKVIVTVTRGKVKVGYKQKTFGIVVPNQQLSVSTDNYAFSESDVNAASVVAWKQEFFIMSDITMEDAALLIDEKYHVKISFSNEKLKKYKITATFLNSESLEHVLTVACGIVNATFVQQPNDQVIINGGNTE